MKRLRKEKGITQEQLAEILNVSGRTVSRWETGSNMPDIGLLVEISEFYDVSIPEIIKGERKSEAMEKEVKEVAEVLSDYAETEKALLLKKVRAISIVGLISLLAGLIMESLHADFALPIYEYAMGVAIGALIVMVLYTTGILAKIKEKRSRQMKVIGVICFVVWIFCLIAETITSFF